MIVYNSSYSVTDGVGNPLVDVDVTSKKFDPKNVDSGFEQKVAAIGQGTKILQPKAVFTPAAGGRILKSNSGGVSFKAMDGAGSMSVKSDTKEAEFSVSDGELELPGLKDGENFEVEIKGEGSGDELIVKGTGIGNGGARIVKTSGNLVLEGVRVDEISLDGRDNKSGTDINTLDISLTRYQYKYSGSAIIPELTVKNNGTPLKERSDFVVSYSDNTDRGRATMIITGVGSYRGERRISFLIADEDREDIYPVQFDLNGHGTKQPDDQFVVKGEKAVKPNNPMETGWKFEGWYEDRECSKDKEYKFDKPVTQSFTLYAKWRSLDGDVPELAVRFSDDPEDGEIISYDPETKEYYCDYTGNKIKPAVIVTYGSRILKEGTDYTLAYSANQKVTKPDKTAYVTVKLKGNFNGNKKLEFKVRAKNISSDDIEVEPLIVQTGKKVTPVITYGEYQLGTKDYEVSPKNPVAGSVSSITITGKGNFTGKIESVSVNAKTADEMKQYTIKADLAIKKAKVFNGKVQELTTEELIVYNAKDGKSKPLTKDTDYTVTYKNNTDAGTAKIIVKGKGSYFGKVTKTFKIKPDTNRDDGLKIVSDNGGKDIYCVSGPATVKLIVTKNKNGTVELIEGKDYTVKYTNNTKPGGKATAKITFIGNYKGRPKATFGFTISPAPFTMAALSACDMVYLKPAKLKPSVFVTIGDTVIDSKNYTVKIFSGKDDYTNKKYELTGDSAVITVEATGKKNFKSEKISGTFTLRKLPDGAIDLTGAKIYDTTTGKVLKKAEYTGRPVEPKIEVRAKKGSGYETVSSANYSVRYLNNTERGKATVIVTGDNSKAFGTKTATFTIAVRKIKLEEIVDLIFKKN